MPSEPVRVVHYLNQFFAGQGGEEKANVPPRRLDAPAGPGVLLSQLLGAEGKLVGTVFGGDNYVSESPEAALDEIVRLVREVEPDVLVAGPAFNAGRYGVACAHVGQRASTELDIPCLTAMYRENPGLAVYRGYRNPQLYCLPTAEMATSMREAMSRMARFALRLARGERVGPAAEEGYEPRGIRRLEQADQTGADRALAMLKAKLAGQPFVTELRLTQSERVPPAPPLASPSTARVAIVTTAGVVPYDNPDGFFLRGNTFWRKYAVEGLERLESGRWRVVHGGCSTSWMDADPNLGAPLDGLRSWEHTEVFGQVAPWYYVMPGVGVELRHAMRVGREIAADLRSHGIDGALLVST